MAINGGYFQPMPAGGFSVGRPHVMNKAGNLYKIPVHTPTPTNPNKTYEVWATRQAINAHFPGLEQPTPHHFEAFAREHYQKTLENKEYARHPGVFISTTQKVHGNPKIFNSMINDPEADFV